MSIMSVKFRRFYLCIECLGVFALSKRFIGYAPIGIGRILIVLGDNDGWGFIVQ